MTQTFFASEVERERLERHLKDIKVKETAAINFLSEFFQRNLQPASSPTSALSNVSADSVPAAPSDMKSLQARLQDLQRASDSTPVRPMPGATRACSQQEAAMEPAFQPAAKRRKSVRQVDVPSMAEPSAKGSPCDGPAGSPRASSTGSPHSVRPKITWVNPLKRTPLASQKPAADGAQDTEAQSPSGVAPMDIDSPAIGPPQPASDAGAHQGDGVQQQETSRQHAQAPRGHTSKGHKRKERDEPSGSPVFRMQAPADDVIIDLTSASESENEPPSPDTPQAPSSPAHSKSPLGKLLNSKHATPDSASQAGSRPAKRTKAAIKAAWLLQHDEGEDSDGQRPCNEPPQPIHATAAASRPHAAAPPAAAAQADAFGTDRKAAASRPCQHNGNSSAFCADCFCAGPASAASVIPASDTPEDAASTPLSGPGASAATQQPAFQAPSSPGGASTLSDSDVDITTTTSIPPERPVAASSCIPTSTSVPAGGMAASASQQPGGGPPGSSGIPAPAQPFVSNAFDASSSDSDGDSADDTADRDGGGSGGSSGDEPELVGESNEPARRPQPMQRAAPQPAPVGSTRPQAPTDHAAAPPPHGPVAPSIPGHAPTIGQPPVVLTVPLPTSRGVLGRLRERLDPEDRNRTAALLAGGAKRRKVVSEANFSGLQDPPSHGGPDMQQPPAAKRQSLHEHEWSTRDGQPAGAATTAGGLLKYEAQQQQDDDMSSLPSNLGSDAEDADNESQDPDVIIMGSPTAPGASAAPAAPAPGPAMGPRADSSEPVLVSHSGFSSDQSNGPHAQPRGCPEGSAPARRPHQTYANLLPRSQAAATEPRHWCMQSSKMPSIGGLAGLAHRVQPRAAAASGRRIPADGGQQQGPSTGPGQQPDSEQQPARASGAAQHDGNAEDGSRLADDPSADEAPGAEAMPPTSSAANAEWDAIQKAEWEQRRIEVEKQAEEARRLKRQRKAAAEVERRAQVQHLMNPYSS
ncbi:hypothetical protein WJX84_011513 [Apatococcus fuscideae]|uniref:Uncharacterized protein n=1 Tax=Apatococcus fuscideae TaxID=2026836 RepID=A0AAW1SNA4_9CHLO